MTKEEAVSIIEERIHVTEYVESSYVDCVDIEALRIAIKALEQPERKKGKWIKKRNSDLLYCSECDLPSMHNWPYCERCGADMRGERR